MKRLTKRAKSGNVYVTGVASVCWGGRTVGDRLFCVNCNGAKHNSDIDRRKCGPLAVIDRLADYEDTGLKPEEITALIAPQNAPLTMVSIDTLRALVIATKSMRYNPEIDPDVAAAYELALFNLLDELSKEMDNPPLTLKELRKMDGQPVFVVPLGKSAKPEYALVSVENEWLCASDADYWEFEVYGIGVLAYRRKPEEGMA